MEKRDEFLIPEEIAEWIGLKKSEYLSRLISHVDTDDIGFEQYHNYDHLVPSTIESPDRMYERIEDKMKVRLYTRAFTEGFHLAVLGVLVPDKASGDQVFVPILHFVTKKPELIKRFSQGEELIRPTFS